MASGLGLLALIHDESNLTMDRNNAMMQGTGQAFPASIPASIKGWDAISSVADMPPDHAVQLDNFIPRPGYLEVRRGSQVFSDTGAPPLRLKH